MNLLNFVSEENTSTDISLVFHQYGKFVSDIVILNVHIYKMLLIFIK